jgi:hypothetical protein
VQSLGTRQQFTVRAVPTAPDTDFGAVAAFQLEAGELMRLVAGAGEEISREAERLRHMRAALIETPRADPALFARLDALEATLESLQTRLSGDRIRWQLDEATEPSIRDRVGRVLDGHWNTRQTPTATQRRSLELAGDGFADLSRDLAALIEDDIPRLEADLAAVGAPWTPGRRLQPD